MATRGNGGQAFGELKAEVAGLGESLHDFRTETRKLLDEMKGDLVVRLNDHAIRLTSLERAKQYFEGRITGIIGTLTLVCMAAYGFIQLLLALKR